MGFDHVIFTKFLCLLKLLCPYLYSATAKSLQSCQTLRDPMDCSPPGSSAHGIFQARVLEWGAIAFSEKLYTISKNKTGS